jgi:hypothetical protein
MSQRRKRLQAEVGAFLRQYARKRPRSGFDPNDRQYDRKLEEALKRMKPEELDRLLNDGGGVEN